MPMHRQENDREHAARKGARPLRPSVFWSVVRAAGLMPMTCAFAVLYLTFALVITSVEPGITRLSDALWYLFTAVTTIGFGDFTCVTAVGRMATVAMSFYSLFFFALITGAVVSYCSEYMRLKRDESVARFIYQLEHLPELSHEELEELSERVRRMD